MEKVICKRCLFDNTIAIIGEKQCNYCDIHDQLSVMYDCSDFKSVLDKIKKKGKNKRYDCLIGISGGLDSSTMVYSAVVHWGLRPLLIHFDNQWNAPEAKSNMNNLVSYLNLDLITYGINQSEYMDLNFAFLKAGLIDADIPNDIAMTKLMYDTADKYGIKYILNGHDFRTEGSTPAKWTYMDAKYIESVYNWFTGKKLTNYPLFTFKDQILYALKGIKQIRPFYYITNRDELEREMKKQIRWNDYGAKHCENIYTEFVGSYLLPVKFGIDKRIVYLSALMRSGKITRQESEQSLSVHSIFSINKLGELSQKISYYVSDGDSKQRSDFDRYDFKKYRLVIWMLMKLKIVPFTFYKKYACNN